MSTSIIKKLTCVGPLLIRFFSRRNIPFRSKFLVVAAILYIVLPFDLIPDFLPFVGWLEDIIIGLLTLGYVQRKIVPDNPVHKKKDGDIIDIEAKIIDENS